jgi:hypothetical protein
VPAARADDQDLRGSDETGAVTVSGRYDVTSAASLADACGPHRYAEVLIFDGLSS